MRRLSAVLGVMVCLTAPPAQSTPQTLSLDPARSSVSFAIAILGVTYSHGRFAEVSGVLTRGDTLWRDASVDVDVNVDSVQSGSARTDRLIESPALFDAARFPQVRFLSRKITLVGDHQAQIDGDLTLHGVTRPIALLAQLPPTAGAEETFTATARLKRSDFGMDGFHLLIGDEVTLTIQATFDAAP